MSAEKLYAMIGDMRREQEFYCAQPIFAEFVHAHEYEAVKELNVELLEALESIVAQTSNPANAEHTLGSWINGACFSDARAAIAKAKGGAA